MEFTSRKVRSARQLEIRQAGINWKDKLRQSIGRRREGNVVDADVGVEGGAEVEARSGGERKEGEGGEEGVLVAELEARRPFENHVGRGGRVAFKKFR
jgi:hypothetical protein